MDIFLACNFRKETRILGKITKRKAIKNKRNHIQGKPKIAMDPKSERTYCKWSIQTQHPNSSQKETNLSSTLGSSKIRT